MHFQFSLALVGLFWLAACTSFGEQTVAATQAPQATQASATIAGTDPPDISTEVPMSFELTSPAFSQGEPIPEKYSCKGEDISPPLAWDDPPQGTQSFVLTMDDPDAPVGIWDHWILFNIPANTRGLEENLPITGANPGWILVGNNSWGRADYGGPCPPSGTHRYFFKLYAVDTTLSLQSGASKGQVLESINGHILTQAGLMGTFSR
jgi:Raf kinase inhibitor-like YbhB/YbcL family protein